MGNSNAAVINTKWNVCTVLSAFLLPSSAGKIRTFSSTATTPSGHEISETPRDVGVCPQLQANKEFFTEHQLCVSPASQVHSIDSTHAPEERTSSRGWRTLSLRCPPVQIAELFHLLSVYQKFPQPLPWVWLICLIGKQNSGKCLLFSV